MKVTPPPERPAFSDRVYGEARCRRYLFDRFDDQAPAAPGDPSSPRSAPNAPPAGWEGVPGRQG